jgi:hypothetical protein
MLLMYFLNDFEIVPVAPIITGITLVFTLHMRWVSIVRSLYLYYLLLLLLLCCCCCFPLSQASSSRYFSS